MANLFLISDTHFKHEKILTFKRADNVTPLRPFSCVEEMDEHMVDNWNKVVRKHDSVLHLGDVAMRKADLEILGRLNGKKKLLFGNHDIFHATEYLKYFDNVAAYRVFENTGIICSHIPISLESKGRFKLNIAGHTHGNPPADPFYYSVCVEQIDYTPIPYDDILKYMDRYLSD